MAVQIQYRRGTAAEWASANPVLAIGEPGYETDTGRFKVGDGTNPWNALSYSSGIQGANATVSLGATTITAPGTSPAVTDSDPSANGVILNFSLPRVNTVSLNPTNRVLSPASQPTVIDQGASGNIILSFGFGWANTLNTNTVSNIWPPGSLPNVRDTGNAGNVVLTFGFPLPNTLNVNPAQTLILSPGSLPNVRDISTTSGNIVLAFGFPLQNGLSLGTSRVLSPGAQPDVTNQGTSGNVSLSFGFPWANTLNVNNQILVLSPSASPNIRDTGNAGNAIISFGLPRAYTIAPNNTISIAPGLSANVNNSPLNGNTTDVRLDFWIPRGNVGDKAGYKVAYNSTTTDANPGQSNIRFDSITFTSVTRLYINTLSKLGNDWSGYINSWSDSSSTGTKGYIELQSNWDGGYNTSVWAITSMVAPSTPATGGYAKLAISPVVGTRLPNDGEDMVIRFTRTGDKGNTGNMAPKSITMMYPAPTDNVIIFYNPTYARTLARVQTVVKGTSPSVTYSIRYNANSDPSNTVTRFDILTANTIANTNHGQANTSFVNSVIPANTWVWVWPSAVSGTVQQFHLTMEFAN